MRSSREGGTDDSPPPPESKGVSAAEARKGAGMTNHSSRKIFLNLPVRDLERTKEFFANLGFSFNRQFTDEKAACMVISEEAFVMLLAESFFRTFTRKNLCDTTTSSEALFALSCGSRAEVDELVRRALAAGGSPAMDPVDHGFMYGWSFYDPDGHHWEVLWMDPKVIQKEPMATEGPSAV